VISRNAFDFCIRGYSHGVYNRGQDSAGILMFEQCCQNIIAENSATHCGDGFFGFAGKEALGEVNLREDLEWYKGRGCNENVICHNDFSDSAAHGLELTFSFDNSIYRNSFTGNAICGIWGGYSQGLTIVDNNFMANGDKPSGNERGAINIEHGDQNLITGNALTFHSCALRLWRDDDAGPRATRWAEANYPASPLNAIQQNLFHENLNNVELRDAGLVSLHGNATQPMETITTGIMVAVKADADPQTCLDDRLWDTTARMAPLLEIERSGRFETRMTHSSLAGRQSIIMTEWGPWDHEGPQPTTQPANTKDD
jgi:hypothetical protein